MALSHSGPPFNSFVDFHFYFRSLSSPLPSSAFTGEVRETNSQPFYLLLEKSRGIELTRLASRARSPGVQIWVTQGHRDELQEGDTEVNSALHPCLGWDTFLRLELCG